MIENNDNKQISLPTVEKNDSDCARSAPKVIAEPKYLLPCLTRTRLQIVELLANCKEMSGSEIANS